MQRCFTAALCALTISPWLVTGCGSSPVAGSASTVITTTTPPTVTSKPIDGRWSVSPFVTAPPGSSALPPVFGAQFQGAFSTSGSQVTGVGQVSLLAEPGSSNFACARPPQSVVLHGTVNAAHHVSLLSDPIGNGGTLQIELDVPSDPHQPSTGTTTFTTPCFTATSNAHGLLYEPISGSFRGSVSGVDPVTLKQVTLGLADAVLSEMAPDASGESVVSGNLAVQFSGCSVHIALDEVRIGSALVLPFASVLDSPDGTRLNGVISGLGQDCKPVAIVPFAVTNNILLTMTKQ